MNEYLPDRVTHPGETLADAIEEIGMSQSELADRTGRPKKTINEIIKGQTTIIPETAIQLERVLGIPASFWISRQRQYDESEARAKERGRLAGQLDWMKSFPVSQMTKLGWLQHKASAVARLEALLSFFAIGSPEEWAKVWDKPRREAVFRTSKAHPANPKALSAWLRRGEIEAGRLSCKSYNRTTFQNALQDIRLMLSELPNELDRRIQERCGEAGVAAVFVPLISGVHAWGATRWIAPDRAMLLLSLKGKWEDVFWFTFFHESAHILLHGKKSMFVDSGPGLPNKEEEEADSWASEFLIPEALWHSFIEGKSVFTESEVSRFAALSGISPAIVVGRLQHEGLLPNTRLNSLRRRIQFSLVL